jgi:nucleoside-diphosphate-sugar epimerase
MKRVLLTGASGTVGKEVLKQLCDSSGKYHISVFDIKSRQSELFLNKFKDRAEIIYGDLRKKDEVSAACSEKDFVIHLAAIIPPLADQNPRLAEEVNAGGTRNLIVSLQEKSPACFFLYSSSISVYGDRISNPWIKVSDPLTPSDRDEYARTKIKAEKLVRESSLSWSIFRLTAIMGTDNHKPGGLMFHMPLNTCMEIASPADTGRAIVNALEKHEVLNGRIFNLSGGAKCRIVYSDFIDRSFRIFGLGKADFREDSFAAKNFHCGYYEDGDELNRILDFQRETIEDYFDSLRKGVPIYRKIPTILFRKLIKQRLQSKSDPLKAIITGNQEDIRHFF